MRAQGSGAQAARESGRRRYRSPERLPRRARTLLAPGRKRRKGIKRVLTNRCSGVVGKKKGAATFIGH